MTAMEKIDKHEFFESSNNAYSLRGHKCKIAVQRSRTVARSAFFSQRVVTSWNKLPDEVVNATSKTGWIDVTGGAIESHSSTKPDFINYQVSSINRF